MTPVPPLRKPHIRIEGDVGSGDAGSVDAGTADTAGGDGDGAGDGHGDGHALALGLGWCQGQGQAPTTLRRSYHNGTLTEDELAPSWVEQFAAWFADASAPGTGVVEPNAMVFATADEHGRPSARTVLLKGFDRRGFTLYTNYTSRKGREAAANPHGSLVFGWHALERQVVVLGGIERVSAAEAEAYFRSRPRGSQLGAWASRQSSVVEGRDVLDRRRAELEARWPEPAPVPFPRFWGGLRVVPDSVEFWQGRPDRLHDRLRYRRLLPGADEWVVERLAP